MSARGRVFFMLAVTSVVAASACLVSIDDSKVQGGGGSDAAGDGTNSDGASDGGVGSDASGDASGGCRAGMLSVPDGAKRLFCIDPTEVTVGQYAAFLDDAGPPDIARLPPECRWKGFLSYVPDNWNPGGDKTLPVSGVDWCDAWAFCKNAGKRLCQGIGGGGAEFYEGFADASASEWMNACTGGGAHAYPYGAAYDPTACAGGDYVPKPTAQLPVKQAARCIGGYAGLDDMSGNVSEWEDSCVDAHVPANCDASGPECDQCHVRGGSFFGTSAQLRCDYGDNVHRRLRLDELGFRCCAD